MSAYRTSYFTASGTESEITEGFTFTLFPGPFEILAEGVGFSQSFTLTGDTLFTVSTALAFNTVSTKALVEDLTDAVALSAALENTVESNVALNAALGFSQTFTLSQVVSLISSLALNDQLGELEMYTKLIDTLRMSADQLTSSFISNESLEDTVAFQDATILSFLLILSDAIDFTATQSAQLESIRKVIDKVAITTTESNTTIATDALVTALAFTTVIDSAYLHAIEDSIGFEEAVEHWGEYIVGLVSNVAMSDTVTPLMTMTAVLEDHISVADTLTSTAEFNEVLQESIGVVIRLQIPGEEGTEFVGWVANARTKAFSQYTNFNFNSFASARGKHFAASQDGIYLLEGNDDDGEPIEASIRTGLLNLGTRKEKAIPDAYIGYTADGKIYLKVILDEEGVKNAFVYELDEATQSAYTQGRVKIGKGLHSRYWAFEVSNADGVNFELDTVEVLPVVLNRRI